MDNSIDDSTIKDALLSVNQKEHESVEKYDYFICGMAGALFAYIGQTYTPKRFDCWYSLLTPLALLSLTVCIGCGLRRMHISNIVTKMNKDTLADSLNVIDLHRELKKIVDDENYISMEIETGEKLDAKALFKKIDEKRLKIQDEKTLTRFKIRRANCLGTWRNLFLFMGFLLLLASKVLQPYF
jgi:hypothetical protein